MARRAARIDGNQSDIVDALRASGASVQSLAEVGNGCPDLLCAIPGWNFLIEIKDSSQAPSDRRLTPQQKKWHTDWLGPVHLAETIEQALMILDHYRTKGKRNEKAIATL